MIALAGGIEPIGRAGQASRRLSWDEVHAADPEIFLLAPCGFALDRVVSEWADIRDRPEWSRLAAVRTGRVVLTERPPGFLPSLDGVVLAAAIYFPLIRLVLAP